MSKSYTQENAYILASIDNEGYNTAEIKTNAEKLQFLFDTFQSEYGWHIKQVGTMRALTSWLAGLPSSCTIVFYNWDIIELAKKWGSLPANATKKQEQKILDNYFQFMAMRIISMWNKAKIGKHEGLSLDAIRTA